ncbi:homocysteine S-methyltransferase family protein [Pseudovibrio sp. SPO723]|uniref:homocysteine S-methyltransferase family protein n=1 Tax=Nesiotobacter zosterae TaxID=392721 RepID=UPI0029C4B9C6|nr:homocysteine S-methyltransferase family protein [Pseudovibrio sp. SPO723]MDX5595473.1 homocysteine S-methyltransferase family protein [Pseudovibrio sp. SPO723]
MKRTKGNVAGMITILDGGMGQELIARTSAEPTPLWATQVMLDEPALVRAVHDDFFAAGAMVATANTYAIHHDRLMPAGIDDKFEALHRTACEIACAARDAAGAGRVAGALGPLIGSYRVGPLPEDAVERFREICRLQAPLVDLFLIETASSLEQARAAVAGATGHDKPIWLGVSVDDQDGTKLRSGEPLEEVMRTTSKIDALLINCSTPEAVSAGLDVIKTADRPFGAYANGFTRITKSFVQEGATVSELSARSDLSPAAYADFAEHWAKMGATIIGGCCEVGPAHIAELVRRLT